MRTELTALIVAILLVVLASQQLMAAKAVGQALGAH
ncbi:hypothetical protein JOD31_001302 [Methylopila capsulata]|uniref:Uncharacterized protein n=1 Tax=Methylopila capsulata TaxID=61654 RepID=A0ABS2T8G3_9HYPH|nr:hypothetical protein [Methylopila capsulata]